MPWPNPGHAVFVLALYGRLPSCQRGGPADIEFERLIRRQSQDRVGAFLCGFRLTEELVEHGSREQGPALAHRVA